MDTNQQPRHRTSGRQHSRLLLSTSDGGKPEHVTVYQSRNEDAIDHVLHIPVKMVVSIKVLMDLEINTPDR